jgi:hypothetical protein
MSYLFTIIAFVFVAVGALVYFADECQHRLEETDDLQTNTKQVRELMMMTYLLVAILIMLGDIADRLR